MQRPFTMLWLPSRTLFVAAFLPLFLPLSLLLSVLSTTVQGETKSYVGKDACKGCHEEKYVSFTTHSKMSHSFQSIVRRKKGLTGEEIKKCYGCHTTGYGKPGGFISEAETPNMKDLGCESCHGPGSMHVASANPRDIRKHVEIKDCETCHDKDRIAAFNYRPLIFGGAHK